MIRFRSVAVVVLLAASSLLTLKLMGLSQWIQAILVIAVELLLGVLLHSMIDGSRHRQPPAHRRRPSHRLALPSTHRRKHPAGHRPVDHPVETSYAPDCRLMLPVREDRPELVEYAIRECRTHRAELDLLFVRQMAALPMSPAFEPTEEEDAEARGVIDGARRRAERAGVPFRSSYAVTHRAPTTILAMAEAREADLLVMAAPRRGRGSLVSRLLGHDDVRAVLDALPDHIGLLVHA